ncbi:3-oxoacyl-ACP reductase [Opitutaceae bacterium TAV5]|nr:3-oxoacyl-ACP reductase [Opitutaceae bacterium TAV5]
MSTPSVSIPDSAACPASGRPTPFSLHGRTALVTGSSKGIGLACGLALRDAGAHVIFHGRVPCPADLPDDSSYIAADIGTFDGIQTLADAAFSDAAPHPADILVNCAGSYFDVPFGEITPAIWQQTFDVNVRSAFFLSQAFANARGKRGGAIVIVSSTNGFQAEAQSAVYDTSKGALVMMTRTLALALAPQNIRVNGIAPGLIRTPLTGWLDTNDVLRSHYEHKILQARIGRAEECGPACVYLCSDASSYMTGQTLVIDGGLTVGQIGRLPEASP